MNIIAVIALYDEDEGIIQVSGHGDTMVEAVKDAIAELKDATDQVSGVTP